VYRDLDLENTPITKLPNNLKVGNWLNLTGTKITELPDDLEAGGIDLTDTPLANQYIKQNNRKKGAAIAALQRDIEANGGPASIHIKL